MCHLAATLSYCDSIPDDVVFKYDQRPFLQKFYWVVPTWCEIAWEGITWGWGYMGWYCSGWDNMGWEYLGMRELWAAVCIDSIYLQPITLLPRWIKNQNSPVLKKWYIGRMRGFIKKGTLIAIKQNNWPRKLMCNQSIKLKYVTLPNFESIFIIVTIILTF